MDGSDLCKLKLDQPKYLMLGLNLEVLFRKKLGRILLYSPINRAHIQLAKIEAFLFEICNDEYIK